MSNTRFPDLIRETGAKVSAGVWPGCMEEADKFPERA